jgi:hypothetical protein
MIMYSRWRKGHLQGEARAQVAQRNDYDPPLDRSKAADGHPRAPGSLALSGQNRPIISRRTDAGNMNELTLSLTGTFMTQTIKDTKGIK